MSNKQQRDEQASTAAVVTSTEKASRVCLLVTAPTHRWRFLCAKISLFLLKVRLYDSQYLIAHRSAIIRFIKPLHQ